MGPDRSISGSSFRGNSAQLRNLAASLERHAVAIEERLRQLDEETAVLSHGWSGEAQQAYAAAHRDWNVQLHRMRDLLAVASSRLCDIDDVYGAASRKIGRKRS